MAILITHIKGLITPLIATHEPPSRPQTRGKGAIEMELNPDFFPKA